MIYHDFCIVFTSDISQMTDEQFLKNLGNKIAELRRKNGLSQTDVGALIDMEKPNLSAIENGRQNPSSLTLKKNCNCSW